MRCQKIALPMNTELNMRTGAMISKVIYGSEKEGSNAIKDYYHFVNENNLHGPSLVAYHSKINDFKDYRRYASMEISERIRNVHGIIDSIASKNSDVKMETDIYRAKLSALYPKTLKDRISLASQEAVRSDSIQPKSNFKKFLVFINRFLEIEE